MTSAAVSDTRWTEIYAVVDQVPFNHEFMSNGGLQIVYRLKCTRWYKLFRSNVGRSYRM